MSSTSDVIVLGGGHNGLVAANYLASAGYRSTLVEAAPQLGGLSTSGPLIAEAPHHVVHPAALDLMVIRATNIIAELDLARYGLREIETDAAYGYLHPTGESVMFFRDPERTIADIHRFSPSDARAYREFLKVLDAGLSLMLPYMRTDPMRPAPRELGRMAAGLVRQRAVTGDLLNVMTSTALTIAEEYFTHPATLGAVLGMAGGTTADPTAEGSGSSMLLPGVLHRVGVSRVRGGMQHFIDALEARFRAAGGTVEAGTPVAEINVSQDRVSGVTLTDGRVLRADVVLSSADPRTTLALVGDALDHRTRVRGRHIPSNGHGVDVMKIDIALAARLSFPDHQRPDGLDLRKPLLSLGTAEDVIGSYAASRRGELPQVPFSWLATPSGYDPSQAPDGQDTVYIYPSAVPRTPNDGWDAAADKMVRLTMKHVGRFAAGFDAEIGRRVETPVQRSERARTDNGALLHVDYGLFRSGPLRPAFGLSGYRTPVEGLFLGGSGSHPNGAVTGLPGQLSARRVARHLATSR